MCWRWRRILCMSPSSLDFSLSFLWRCHIFICVYEKNKCWFCTVMWYCDYKRMVRHFGTVHFWLIWCRINQTGQNLRRKLSQRVKLKVEVKVKLCTLDTGSLRETPLQKRSGMARALNGSHSFTCTPTRSSAVGMSHAWLCLPSYSRYSFTDPGGMEGWVGLGGSLRCETVYLPEVSHPSHY